MTKRGTGTLFVLVPRSCIMDAFYDKIRQKGRGERFIACCVLILFFIGNEGISFLENLGLMGVPFPEFLKKALEALQEKGNSGEGDQV